MSESPYSLDAMREVLGSGDAAGVLEGAVEGFLPDEPNLTRVRTTGGIENEVGEIVGETEDTFAFAAVVAPVEFDTRDTVVGEYRAGDVTAAWLQDDVEGQVLVQGDRVLWRGDPYEVDRLLVPEFNGQADFYAAVLRRQSD